MLNLNDFFYFVQVVDHGGFSAAARALTLPKSRLSRRVNELEESLGLRLLARSSRHVRLTDGGRAFYEHASAMLIEAEAAELAVKDRLGEPSGRVRLACSVAVAQFVTAELLPLFMSQYPKVKVAQQASNHYVDPIAEGFDLVIRAHDGPLPDSTLIKRWLAKVPWGLFAAPDFFKPDEWPTEPEALVGVTALMLGSDGEGVWKLRQPGSKDVSATIAFAPRFASNDMSSLKRAAAAGIGVVALPLYICRNEVSQGELIRVLPEWIAGDPQISLLMPSRRGQLPAVKALASFLGEHFQSLTRA